MCRVSLEHKVYWALKAYWVHKVAKALKVCRARVYKELVAYRAYKAPKEAVA